jgi:c-di-GMP-binding flagellar brake protein YcgR
VNNLINFKNKAFYFMAENNDKKAFERRRYPRVTLPVYCRPARLMAGRPSSQQPLLDIGLGGVRVYSDEELALGERLEIELFFSDNTSMTCTVKVVWINRLSKNAPANYEVGLSFIEIKPLDARRLESLLAEEAANGYVED